MKTYFDSSALIAAFVEEEEHHVSASEALLGTTDGFTCHHTVAEVFGTLTGGRLSLQLSPRDATEMIVANIVQRLEVVALSLNDYMTALKESQTVGGRGGAVFDMLHLQAARRGRARRVYTINVRHFQILAPDLQSIIALPT